MVVSTPMIVYTLRVKLLWCLKAPCKSFHVEKVIFFCCYCNYLLKKNSCIPIYKHEYFLKLYILL